MSFKKTKNLYYLIFLIFLQKPLISIAEDLGEIIIDDTKVLQHLKETTELDEQDLTSQYIISISDTEMILRYPREGTNLYIFTIWEKVD